MDSSRRAVESYWRSRMVDAVTSDEDKVAPVYKLEEICELLRVSDSNIVKEMSEFILKRLDHKNPVVKQKALRLIKYAVGKSGNEFRREMQRNSASVRQLAHYKGHPDPLKGDALNKSVRETANEAISSIFSIDDTSTNRHLATSSTATSVEGGLGKRIQGFGNTNFEPSREDKKSFLSEVVGNLGIGSASIKQGLSTFNIMKNDNNYSSNIGGGGGISGSYKSPNLRRSLTGDKDFEGYNGNNGSSKYSNSFAGSSKWAPPESTSGAGSDEPGLDPNSNSGSNSTSNSGVKSREERLLETVVTAGGVRLQPTRDALNAFLNEAAKLDSVAMSRAIEIKLQSPLWQVRMKAICVLESILRKKNEEPYSIICSFFSEKSESVVKCCELPQVSLREKASKVLGLLDGDQSTGQRNSSDPSVTESKSSSPPVQMPDLIDTGDSNETDLLTETAPVHKNPSTDQDLTEILSAPVPPIDDLFADVSTTTPKSNGTDPFADVAFHISEESKEPSSDPPSDPPSDLFSGLTVDDKSGANKSKLPDIFAGFDVNPTENQNSVNDLMARLNITGVPQTGPPASQAATAGPLNLNSLFGANPVYPAQVPAQYGFPTHLMLNQALAGQQVNYAAMGALIAQQQQLLQNFGNFNSGLGNSNVNNNLGFTHMESGSGGYSSPLPDIFQVNNINIPVQSHITMTNSPKKEETKAFDFVSDHLAAARGSKRVI